MQCNCPVGLCFVSVHVSFRRSVINKVNLLQLSWLHLHLCLKGISQFQCDPFHLPPSVEFVVSKWLWQISDHLFTVYLKVTFTGRHEIVYSQILVIFFKHTSLLVMPFGSALLSSAFWISIILSRIAARFCRDRTCMYVILLHVVHVLF